MTRKKTEQSDTNLPEKILGHMKSPRYQPQRPRKLARELELHEERDYPAFREALRELMDQGRVTIGAKGSVVLPTAHGARSEIVGTYRHNKRGFGFVIPTDPASHEDLFIPPGDNFNAMNGDIVRARITSRSRKDGKQQFGGRVVEIIERAHNRFAGTLQKQHGQWVVVPDGATHPEPIHTPDAGARHIKPGTKVVVEITEYSDDTNLAEGVITEVLGLAGEKDVDLKSVIVQFNLPNEFPDEVKAEARHAVDQFKHQPTDRRLDLTREVILTIDPDDAKDYDDAISLTVDEHGREVLGVHIADVSYFVPEGSKLDDEARERGNSTYFPGYVIPMLPEILSNGVCSLQEGVSRFCKSAFITFDDDARPLHTQFSNSVIRSACRLRYTEAQDLIDGKRDIRHPDGKRRRTDYPEAVLKLLDRMNSLAMRIQARRRQQGQIVLELPQVDLVLDEEGKVIDARPEDQSFTHTLIEMFMVEANEAVARLLDSLNVPFLRRIHPDPVVEDARRLKHFTDVAGYHVPKELDRKQIQKLLEAVRGKPESFAINMAVLKSLTRAEYSPEQIGHYALASEHYSHFTSPIRRYADLTIHRLLDAWFAQVGDDFRAGPKDRGRGGRKAQVRLEGVPSEGDLVELGKHLSFTERRSESAENELRKVKLLELLSKKLGTEFNGVVSGIANFGLFVQLDVWLIDGLVRYDDLFDDWWDVDEKAGVVKGQRSGIRIGIGDVVKVIIAKVDVPKRELDLAITKIARKSGRGAQEEQTQSNLKKGKRGRNLKSDDRNHAQRGRKIKNSRFPRQSRHRKR